MSILESILIEKAKEVEKARTLVSIESLKARCERLPRPLGFADAISRAPAPRVIAEIKRASPSRGEIRPDLSPVDTALSFAAAGAVCLSVLTDEKFFMGSLAFLGQVRAQAPDIPLLRKDFLLDPYQVWESRANGADAVLLIVAALEPKLLLILAKECAAASLDILVEVHTAEELERAVEMFVELGDIDSQRSTLLLGINNRNLHNFEIDLEVTARLSGMFKKALTRAGCQRTALRPFVVTESGIHQPADIARLCGFADAFLVGESLVAQGDPGSNLRSLLEGAKSLLPAAINAIR